MSTSINLEPPPADESQTLDELLTPGSDVLVELCGRLYPGKVSRVQAIDGEISIETTAARQMSRQWKTLLFYIESRLAVYGLAKLVVPGIDAYDPTLINPEYEKKKPGEEPAQFDAPENLSRDNDDPDWEEKSTLEPEEERELWWQHEER